MFRSRKLFHQLNARVGLEIAGVAFIGVNVDLQFEAFVHAGQHPVESDAAIAADFELHHVTVLHPVKISIGRAEVRMTQGANHAIRHLEKSVRTHKHGAGRAFDVARGAQRNIKAQGDSVRVGQLNLIERTARTQDTEIGNHSTAWADEGHGFLRGELPFLIKPLVDLQLVAFSEKRVHRVLGKMAMPGADVHHEWIRRRGRAGQRFAEARIHRLPNQVFDDGSMRSGCSNSHNATSFDRFNHSVNKYLATSSNIFQTVARMTAEERKHRLEAYLQQVEFASLEDLATHVGSSVSTVRRDLTVLEAAGNLKRTHGGARIVTPKSDEFTFSARDTHQLDSKEAIGRACAELIGPNQSVIIDAGTTTFHVAKHLEDKSPQIVTNSLPIANLYSSAGKVELVLSGGVIYPRLGVLVGPLAVEAFSKINADVAVMSSGGITMDGITNSHGLLIDIQLAMMRAAAKVIFCLDHTKFGRRSVSQLCDLSKVHTIVTDSQAPAELVDQLRGKGLEVIVASEA